MRYLVPCTCGRKIPVSTSQAGDALSCECGQTFPAPNLRELRRLETAPDVAPPPRRRLAWGQVQGALFATGGVLLLLGVIVLGVVGMQRSYLVTDKPPIIPELLDQYLAEIDNNTPVQNFELWQKEVLEEGLSREHVPHFVYHRRIDERMKLVMIGAGVVSALGLGLIASTFFLRPKKR